MAKWLIEELEAEKDWERRFAESEDILGSLAMKLLGFIEREKANQWILIAYEVKNHRQILEELRRIAC